MKTKDFSKIFFASILTLFVFFSLGVIGYSIYYYNNTPLTSRTYYLNTLNFVNSNEDDAVYAFEANMYTNANNNGKYCFELITNYYTDSEIPETPGEYKNVYSSGIQIADLFGSIKHYESAFLNMGDSYTWYTLGSDYYYNKTHETSYSAVKKLGDITHWIVDCNGKLVSMKIRGNVDTGNDHWLGHKDYLKYDFNYLIIKLEKAVRSLKDGLHILQFDLSDFFTFYEYNEDSKNYDKPVEGDLNFTIINIKINKTSNGLIDAKQSMFNMFKEDANYSAVDSVNDYSSYTSTYYLNEFDFDIISNSNGTCYITLKDDIAAFISIFIDLDIICEINLDSTYFIGNYCLGFAENAIKGVDINYCTITSNSPTTFYLNNNAVNVVVNSNITIEGGGI